MPRASSSTVTCVALVLLSVSNPLSLSPRVAASPAATGGLFTIDAGTDACAASPADRVRSSDQPGHAKAERRAETPRRPPAAIQGRIVDERLEPIARAVVSAQRVRFAGGDLRLVSDESSSSPRTSAPSVSTAVTNTRGEYRVDGLPAGQYFVSAVVPTPEPVASQTRAGKPVKERFGFGATFYPGTTYAAQAQRVVVRPGEEVSAIDITLEKKRLARVSGKVVSVRDRLHDGAAVTLAPAPSQGAGRVEGFLGHGKIGADGSFAIENVPPGDYVLKARSIPASVVNEIAVTGTSAPLTRDPESEFGAMPLSVDGEDLDRLALTISPGGRITGTVRLDGHPFKPSRSEGSITAEPVDADSFSAGATRVAVAEDGTFDIRGLFGRFVLRVGDVAPDLTLARVELFGADVTDTGLNVRPREDVADVAVVLSSRPTELTGRVTVATASPATTAMSGGCLVIVFSDDPKRWSWAASRYVATAEPTAGGIFSITGLPPGTYLAVAVSDIEDGQWLDPVYLKSVSRRATEVRLREGESRTLTLRLE
jgi:hypothetical protein